MESPSFQAAKKTRFDLSAYLGVMVRVCHEFKSFGTASGVRVGARPPSFQAANETRVDLSACLEVRVPICSGLRVLGICSELGRDRLNSRPGRTRVAPRPLGGVKASGVWGLVQKGHTRVNPSWAEQTS